MTSLISSLNIVHLVEAFGGDKVVSAIIKDFPDVLSFLKPSQVLSLQVVDLEVLNSTTLKVALNHTGLKEIVVDLVLNKNISLSFDTEHEIQAKVMSNNHNDIKLKLISINGDFPEKYISKPRNLEAKQADFSVVKNVSSLSSNIDVATMKLDKIFEQIKSNLPLSQVSQSKINEIVKEFAKLELKFEVKELLKPVSLDIKQNLLPSLEVVAKNKKLDFIVNLKKLFENVKFDSDSKTIIKQVRDGIENLKNNFAKVNVDRAISGNELLAKTDIGDVLLRSNSKIFGLEKDFSIHLKEVVLADKLLNNQSLKDFVSEAMKTINPKLALIVNAKIPDFNNPKFIVNFASLVKATNDENLALWLGKDVVKEIALQGLEGKEVISKLNNMLSTSVKEVGPWRLIEVPFLLDSGFQNIRIAIKKNKDENAEKKKSKSSGMRFIIDTSFSVLGNIQLDGYVVEKDKKFDLIVRTSDYIDEEICLNIIKIFKTTLVNLEYIGNVSIDVNVEELFVNVYEGEQCLNDGVYI